MRDPKLKIAEGSWGPSNPSLRSMAVRWRDMHYRCTNSANKAYKNYGGRGIKVCVRWRHFELFLADMGMSPTKKHTVERINNDKSYSPSNCRWATKAEQRRNTRGKAGGTSKHKGVALWKGLYRVNIQHFGKQTYLGSFDKEKDAALAYNVAAKKHFGRSAYINKL